VAPHAQLHRTKNGLVPDSDGWFVINARESRWRDGGPLGVFCTFEGRRRFPQLGINVSVLEPGQPMAMYHRENPQEGFLVVSGECRLIVEGDERRLQAWDFFHCPPGTEHVIVGGGDGPAVVIAIGARGRGVSGGVVYPVCEAAAGYGASVTRETTDVRTAYAGANAGLPRSRWISYTGGWLPGG
jgi:quercetin dioxygenase-like cupin family protein